MKTNWLEYARPATSSKLDTAPQESDPTNPATTDGIVREMLSDLPSFGGFTEFDATLPTDSFVRYLATDNPLPQRIKSEKTRCLIRAFRSTSDKRDLKRDQKRERKRAAPETPALSVKRPRWTGLDKEKKQACIRVALAAACRYARNGDRVHELREVWQQNPRRKQMINAEVRSALAESVSQWTEAELRNYLVRASVGGAITKEGMVRAVRDHLAPEIESDRK